MTLRDDLQKLADGPYGAANHMAKRVAGQARGYAGTPGTGPEGETCGSCRHLYRNRMSKTYLKCELNKANWTGGRGSDVLARSPACLRWEAQTGEGER